jgi:hypothetical protein
MTYHESITDWVLRQGWSAEVETAAIMLAEDRVRLGLNPLTLGEWRTWAQHQTALPAIPQEGS